MLIASGAWVRREDLAEVSTCAVAVDDTLADLVIDGLAEFNERTVSYRLAATPAARRAAQLLLTSRRTTAAVGEPGEDFYHVGVAEVRPPLGLLLYELAIPNPEPGPDALRQLQAQSDRVIDFINSRGGPSAGSDL